MLEEEEDNSSCIVSDVERYCLLCEHWHKLIDDHIGGCDKCNRFGCDCDYVVDDEWSYISIMNTTTKDKSENGGETEHQKE